MSGDRGHGLVTEALGPRCTVTGWERPRRRKLRSVRDEARVDDRVELVRAVPVGGQRALRTAALDAAESGRTYVIQGPSGVREVLYGLSVYAVRGPGGIAAVMERFRQAPMVAVVTAGALRRAGFDLIATGSNPDHYDVQLLPGWLEEVTEATDEELHVAVARFLDVAGPLHPNPAYADDVEDRR